MGTLDADGNFGITFASILRSPVGSFFPVSLSLRRSCVGNGGGMRWTGPIFRSSHTSSKAGPHSSSSSLISPCISTFIPLGLCYDWDIIRCSLMRAAVASVCLDDNRSFVRKLYALTDTIWFLYSSYFVQRRFDFDIVEKKSEVYKYSVKFDFHQDLWLKLFFYCPFPIIF